MLRCTPVLAVVFCVYQQSTSSDAAVGSVYTAQQQPFSSICPPLAPYRTSYTPTYNNFFVPVCISPFMCRRNFAARSNVDEL